MNEFYYAFDSDLSITCISVELSESGRLLLS